MAGRIGFIGGEDESDFSTGFWAPHPSLLASCSSHLPFTGVCGQCLKQVLHLIRSDTPGEEHP